MVRSSVFSLLSSDYRKAQVSHWNSSIHQQRFCIWSESERNCKMFQLAVEVFENIKTIQILAVEDYFIGKIRIILESRKKPFFKVKSEKSPSSTLFLQKTIFRALFHGLSHSFSFFSNFLASGNPFPIFYCQVQFLRYRIVPCLHRNGVFARYFYFEG